MYIFRACIKLSYFPEGWKHGIVIPIPKSDKNLSKASSYRSISLLSKVLEKIIVNRINLHLLTNRIIPDDQFGYRRGHSTNHQLMRVSIFIKDSLSNKLSCGMLAFDVEKAFDSIWHKELVYKMFKLKFPLYITKMVQSFLFKRSFHVQVSGAKSKTYNIIARVPQGSVLSPTLFNIFTSDLVISKCMKGMFADLLTTQRISFLQKIPRRFSTTSMPLVSNYMIIASNER